jgi:arsenate reductase
MSLSSITKKDKRTILFLCTYNAARSQIAEAIINAWFGDQYRASSAGSEPTEVHSCVIKVMAELGIDTSRQRAKSVTEFDNGSFDYVITMCADAAENCPIFPSGVTYLHHPFDDPVSAVGSESDTCASFIRVCDQIKEWLESTFGQVG